MVTADGYIAFDGQTPVLSEAIAGPDSGALLFRPASGKLVYTLGIDLLATREEDERSYVKESADSEPEGNVQVMRADLDGRVVRFY